MIKIVVAGAAGRMGREIVRAVVASPGVDLAAGFERPNHEALGQDLGSLAGLGPLNKPLVDSLAEAGRGSEVLIDFTTPQASLANVETAVEMGLAAVVGTTGLSPDQTTWLEELAQRRPVVFSPNMSVGVNVLLKLVGEAARLLGPVFDLEVVEAHHRMKEDAPSGTALGLARALAEARGLDLDQAGVFARQGAVGRRRDDEIGVQAVRAGDIIGEHTVILAGPGERLELIHRAHSRANFAQGAVRAASWVAAQEAGLYSMQDVLGLK
ncbi:MAG: 4-hydroxy-tetrahydrodipicolinate reductase [Deltaproteobacteria bacterium]|nr:4-hydroxy-tetrahydrodipicolinate reductase [Deltaproteobacteria bacterium]